MLRNLRRYFRRDDGVTAIEFALVAMPFFMLIMGILETAMYFASGSVLEGASVDAARLIRTGQVQGSDNPEQTFENELCNRVGNMLNCDNIQYIVMHVGADSFISAQSVQPEYDDQGNIIVPPFDSGHSSSVIIVRAYYKWTFLTPGIGPLISGSVDKDWMGDLSTVGIKSEPYCTSVTGTCSY